jgi:hypothetical protein
MSVCCNRAFGSLILERRVGLFLISHLCENNSDKTLCFMLQVPFIISLTRTLLSKLPLLTLICQLFRGKC